MPRKHDRQQSDKDTAQPKPKRQRLTDSQLERKRELDREAQRTIRERTKNHIAHLEALVQQLQGERGGQVERLVAQLNESRAEVNRLRDALNSIIRISTTVTGAPCITSDGSSQLDHIKNESSSPAIADYSTAKDSRTPVSALGQQTDSCNQIWRSDPSDGDDVREQLPANIVDLNSYSPFETKLSSLHSHDVQQNSTDQDDQETVEEVNNKQLSVSQMAASIVSDTRLEGRYWYLAGVLLSHILKQKGQADSTITFEHDEDIAIRAVFEGWGSVMARYPLDRGWQWLKELDEKVYFNHFGPAERLMHLRNCRFVFLNQLYPDAGWNNNLPAFFAARPSQRYLEHDPLIEHFPWPSFRERLLFSPRQFATNKFMDALRRNFHFVWNYDFNDLYQKNPATGIYHYSDLFTKHIMDMKCYTVHHDFFEKFPRLREDIPWNNPTPLSMISHRFSIASSSADSTAKRIMSPMYEDDDKMDEIDSGYSDSHSRRLGWSFPTSPNYGLHLRLVPQTPEST